MSAGLVVAPLKEYFGPAIFPPMREALLESGVPADIIGRRPSRREMLFPASMFTDIARSSEVQAALPPDHLLFQFKAMNKVFSPTCDAQLKGFELLVKGQPAWRGELVRLAAFRAALGDLRRVLGLADLAPYLRENYLRADDADYVRHFVAHAVGFADYAWSQSACLVWQK